MYDVVNRWVYFIDFRRHTIFTHIYIHVFGLAPSSVLYQTYVLNAWQEWI